MSPRIGPVTRIVAGIAALVFAAGAAGAGYFRDWAAVATLGTGALAFGAAAFLGRDTITDDPAHRSFHLSKGSTAGHDDGAA